MTTSPPTVVATLSRDRLNVPLDAPTITEQSR